MPSAVYKRVKAYSHQKMLAPGDQYRQVLLYVGAPGLGNDEILPTQIGAQTLDNAIQMTAKIVLGNLTNIPDK